MNDVLINFDALPEYRAAVERESLIRDVAFSGLPEYIGGIEVRPFTFRHWLWLTTLQSPFLNAGIPTQKDVADVLWTVSPRRKLGKRQFFGRLRCEWLARRPQLIGQINDYLLDAFMDAPGSTGGDVRASYFSAGAAIIHRLCSAYGGLTPESAINLSLKQGFQLLKIIDRNEAAAAGKKAVQFNPSDAVRGRLAAHIHAHPESQEAKLAVIQRNN